MMRIPYILLAAFLMAAQAGASVINGSASAEFSAGGTIFDSDFEDTLLADAQVTSLPLESDVTFTGPGFARARQDALGNAATEANWIFVLSTGVPDPNRLVAETIFEETITNDTGSTQDFAFDILLQNIFVDLYDFAGVPSGPSPFDGMSQAIGGRVSYEVAINEAAIFSFIGEVYGGGRGPAPFVSVDQTKGINGRAPDGSVVSSILATTARMEPNSIGGIAFSDLSATLDAGTFAPGEEIRLKATMRSEVLTFPFELGARANFGDPNNLSAAGVSPLRATGTAAIPVPGSVWLLLGGVVALAAAACRSGYGHGLSPRPR